MRIAIVDDLAELTALRPRPTWAGCMSEKSKEKPSIAPASHKSRHVPTGLTMRRIRNQAVASLAYTQVPS